MSTGKEDSRAVFKQFSHPTLTLGTDPELFATVGGQVFPAYKWLPSKGKAIRESSGTGLSPSNASLFWDGVQAEFSMSVETGCLAWIVDSVHVGLKAAAKAAKLANPQARLSHKSVVEFPKDERMAAAREHVQLGCKPSINVYGLGGEMVRNGRELPVRFAGGHIHLGLRDILTQRAKCIRALDAVLGVWAVGAAANLDDPIRRRYYGLPGEYRETSYGLEYRTLSNFWLLHPALMNLTFEIARVTVWAAIADSLDWQTFEEDTIQAILKSDVGLARKILEQNKLMFEHLMDQAPFAYYSSRAVKRALDVALYGADAVIPTLTAIEANWRLDGNREWKWHSGGEGCSWASLQAA